MFISECFRAIREHLENGHAERSPTNGSLSCFLFKTILIQAKLYKSVIEDVVKKMAESFQDENIDLGVLKSLKEVRPFAF